MKTIKESITIEYENVNQRKVYMSDMLMKGYSLVKEYSGIDVDGYEHIYADFIIVRQGYKGRNIF